MIPLFRKIRKQLADDNKPLKYFRYAIGEIVLVVVGILIALSINNWNQERKIRLVQVEYLNNIKDDLIADTLSLRQVEKQRAGWELKLGNYYEYYNSREWTVQQIVDSCMNTGFMFINYLPINTTYADMLSSGNTSLLNDDLRKNLSTLQKRQDQLVIIVESINTNIMNNIQEIEKYWDMEYSLFFKYSISKYRNPTPFYDISEIGSQQYANNDQNLMIGLKHHHNVFNWMYKRFDFNTNRGHSIIRQSADIIKLIDDELKD